MGDIIQFRTREEIDGEKKKRLLDEWNAYLKWEQETIKKIQKKISENHSKIRNHPRKLIG